MLLMTAPYTGPAHAYTVGNDRSKRQGSLTRDQPLGNGMPGASDPPRSPIMLQRWGSKGAVL